MCVDEAVSFVDLEGFAEAILASVIGERREEVLYSTLCLGASPTAITSIHWTSASMWGHCALFWRAGIPDKYSSHSLCANCEAPLRCLYSFSIFYL